MKSHFIISLIIFILAIQIPSYAFGQNYSGGGAWKNYIDSITGAPARWQSHIEWTLREQLACHESIDDRAPCNYFVGKALSRIYQINDFQGVTTGSWLSANQISSYVSQNPNKWKLIGSASDQNSLAQAQADANAGAAIIAILENNPNGHVALILPGKLLHSNSWNLSVPNSASFFLDRPLDSYVGKLLS